MFEKQGVRRTSPRDSAEVTGAALQTLPNIGPTIARRLAAVGISSLDDLRQVGAVAAFVKVRRTFPDLSSPVCYYLYSLQAALDGVAWDDMPQESRNDLKGRAEAVLGSRL